MIKLTATLSSVTANNALSPDNTQTAEKVDTTASAGEHFITRAMTLTSFDTFDSTGIKFDSTNDTFDTGSTQSEQRFTSSMFVKKGEYDRVRFTVSLGSGAENAQFSANLTDGTTGSVFTTNGIDVSDRGMVPIGGGWFRIYMTVTLDLDSQHLIQDWSILNSVGALDHTGIANNGLYVWGAKPTTQPLGTYTSVLGTQFFTNGEYNIKTFVIERLRDSTKRALSDTLVFFYIRYI